MIRYKKYQVTGENSPLKGLWYARPVIEETFDIERACQAHVQPQHPLLVRSHQGSAD